MSDTYTGPPIIQIPSEKAQSFEDAAKGALSRELSLLEQQAAKRAREAAAAKADPARQLDRQRFAAGAYGRPGAAANAARQRAAELQASATRRAVDGPETAFGRDSW